MAILPVGIVGVILVAGLVTTIPVAVGIKHEIPMPVYDDAG